jgi:hypothetical protein
MADIVRYWRKPKDSMPVVGQPVVVQYPDGRQTVLYAYPAASKPVYRIQSADDYYWIAVSGQPSPAPAFWLDEQPLDDTVCDTQW